MISRRKFLLGASAATILPRRMFAATSADFDDNLAVFLADVHVNGFDKYPVSKEPIKTCMREWLKRNVAEILRMDPLPRHVVVFGDLAYLNGRLRDYKRSYPDLKLLVDAGIDLTIGMGNHDHREPFLEVWPEYVKRTIVPGFIHTVIRLPGVDLIMLDSLNETAKPEGFNAVDGALSKVSQEWVRDELPKWPRPFILGAHHSARELKFGNGHESLSDLSTLFPNCRGYIHGHDHIWKTDVMNWERDRRGLPLLTLPSNGCWGDIGYTTFRIGKLQGREVAIAQLIQKDFYLRAPVAQEKRNPAWDARMSDNRGHQCAFVL